MLHLDFYTTAAEYETALKQALKCGAVIAEMQFNDAWKVLLDPCGHPFCVIPIPDNYQE